MANSIASRWRELSGEKNWEGLLQPLDIDLRRYVIHYGERAGAVGDVFNSEKESSGFGHSLFPKDELFAGAGLEKGNIFKYSVTDFIYAASEDVESVWFGYVAVTTDEGKAAMGRRDVLVAWRGTMTDSEWFNNVKVFPASASDLFGTKSNAKVHSGFLSLYTGTSSKSTSKTSAREQVLKAVRELVNQYQDEEISITVTGYSLGAALATLNAMDIVANGFNKPTGYSTKKPCMVTAITFAGPRVGNSALEEVFNKLGDDHHNLRLLRTTNFWDPVHRLPWLMDYTHFGKELRINTSKSAYLKRKFFVISRIDLPGNADSTHVPPPEHLPAEYLYGNIQVEEELEIYAATRGYSKHKNYMEEEEKEELEIDATTRGFIDGLTENLGELFIAHSLDVYLHGVAGVQQDGFRLELDHDIALVNKHLDWLKDDHKIPPKWWRNENRKNMVQMDNGHWKFVENT